MDSFILKFILTATPTILCLVLLIYIIAQPRKNNVVYSLILFQLTTFLWTLGNLLEVLALNPTMKWWAIQLSSLPLNFSGVVWLYFCSTYTNQKVFSNKFRTILIILPSIVGELFCITNPYHHLFFSNEELLTAGPVGLILSLILGIYSFVGFRYLFQYASRQKNISAKRSIYYLVLTDLIPLIIEVIYILDVTFVSQSLRLRFFPCFSLSITSIFIVNILFKYRFLDLIPLVQKDIINNLNESIITVENDGKIISYNKSFKRNFPIYDKNKGDKHLKLFIEFLENDTLNLEDNISFFNFLKNNVEELEFTTELILKTNQTFLVTIKPVFAFNNEFVGRIISLTDITEYKKLKEAEYDVIKERNRIAQDVHDTLGHKMTILLCLLEVIEINYGNNPELVKNNIQKAIETVNEGYAELRRSIYGLSYKDLELNNLVTKLKTLFKEYNTSEMVVDFSIAGKIEYYNPIYSEIIYRSCQEALTNSFKHGKAKRISIIIQLTNDKIKLYIFDNGKGCENIVKGLGLSSMEERIKKFNGSIILGSSENEGFNINIELPIKIKGV